jgi:gamma-glutamyl-gamma-aminobutyrate hydrolase PuuD
MELPKNGYIASIDGGFNSHNEYLAKLLQLPVVRIQHTNLEQLKQAKLAVFWGGEDIATSLYCEKPKHTERLQPSFRDLFEKNAFNIAKENKVPMVGICRGAQLLCVLNGGSLWQHVDNHGYSHYVRMNDGTNILVTSTHHQMMRPTKHMHILGVSAEVLSPTKGGELGFTSNTEPETEILFVPETKTLCIQGHPEYTKVDSPFSQLTVKLIKEYLL